MSKERNLLVAVARRIDHERLENAHRYLKASLKDWAPESLSSLNPDLIRTDGVGVMGDHDSLVGAMCRVDVEGGTKVQSLLQFPTVLLLVSMWWTLHDEAVWNHPASLQFALDDGYHAGIRPLAQSVLELANDLFREHTVARDLLSANLSAGHSRHDYPALLGGALWATTHMSMWTGALLFTQEQLQAVEVEHRWSTPLDLTALLLADLKTEFTSDGEQV